MSGGWQTDWTVGVIIPAKNEESTIEKCVQTVRRSLSHAEVRTHWIVVVADGCTDRTVRRARRALGASGEVLETSVRSAGAARRAGAARVLKRFDGIEADVVWLANTDADSYVPTDWISVQLAFAEQGVAGIAGIVDLDLNDCAIAYAAHRATYFTSSQTHSHVHGANLSLRADAYLDVGGWSELPLSEDHCLWNRLRHSGWPLSSPVSSVVTTSARLAGRAEGGFADTLRATVDRQRAIT